MSGKRHSVVLVLALCTAVLAGFVYFRSRRARVSSNILRPGNIHHSDVALAADPASEESYGVASSPSEVYIRPSNTIHHSDVAEESYGVAISPRQGYILVDEYDGQQGAGLESLVSLQCWMKCLQLRNVLLVEPLVTDSAIGGEMNKNKEVRFSDMFDLRAFNQESRSEEAAQMVPYSTYLHNAPRKAIFVKFVMIRRHVNDTSEIPPPELIWESSATHQCYKPTDSSTIIPPPYLEDHHYCYIRVVKAYHKIRTYHTIEAEQFSSIVMGGGQLEGVTLVLSYWRTPWHIGRCPAVTVKPPKITDSPYLLQTAERYKQKMGLTDGKYVAVLLRSEHAYLMIKSHIRFNRPSGYTVKACLDEVQAKTEAAMADLNTSSVFVTADVGRYGSNSWRETLRRGYDKELPGITAEVEGTVEGLYGGRWSFQQWEQSFYGVEGSVDDSGFVAGLQRVLASRAGCLVLLGGGSFQRMLLASYLHNTQAKCVHMVCMDRGYEGHFIRNISTA